MRFTAPALAALATLLLAGSVAAEPATKVFINGRPTPVYFNDGDSFKPMAGPYKGSQSRLAGFNTLESFGSVHSWGTWSAHELWVNAKLATKRAQRGVWHCETDGNKDGYGRLLMHCKDLAKDHVLNGYAQVMSVNKDPGDPELVAAQAEAIKHRRGMWAHGVPSYVLSSLHSAEEGGGKDGKTYNRLVSTTDGHSEKMIHEENYAECQKVCRMQKRLTDAAFPIAADALRANGDLNGLTDDDVYRYTDEFLSFGSATSGRENTATIDAILKPLADAGKLTVDEKEDSCHIYVDFRRRFGGDRAVCLR